MTNLRSFLGFLPCATDTQGADMFTHKKQETLTQGASSSAPKWNDIMPRRCEGSVLLFDWMFSGDVYERGVSH